MHHKKNIGGNEELLDEHFVEVLEIIAILEIHDIVKRR